MVDPSAYYTYQHPDEYHADWRGFYDEALTARDATLERWSHDVDVRYGPHDEQVLDILRPDGPPHAVILYFHGGRWREGAPAFYDHLGEPWLERGAVFVTAGYRKEPAFTIANAVDDAVIALAWVRAQLPDLRIVVAGHSAGAHLAAMLALTERVRVPDAAVLMSGVYELSAFTDDELLSPLTQLAGRTVPTVVSYGDPERNRKADDDRFLTAQGRALAARIDCVEVVLPDTDHRHTAAAFADPDGPLFAAAERVVFS